MLYCGYASERYHRPPIDDKMFNKNIEKAETFGMPWGAYLYSITRHKASAYSEAHHALRMLDGRNPPCGFWYQVGDPNSINADFNEKATMLASPLKKQGIQVGFMMSNYWLVAKMDKVWENYEFCVIDHSDPCTCPFPYGMWEYTEGLYVAGQTFRGLRMYKNYAPSAFSKLGRPCRILKTQPVIIQTPYIHLNSHSGQKHARIDLAWSDNPHDVVMAHSDGVVSRTITGIPNLTQEEASERGQDVLGNRVEIKHANGFRSYYYHLRDVLVSEGEEVKKGQAIGHMGNSGRIYNDPAQKPCLGFNVTAPNQVRESPKTHLQEYLYGDFPGLPTEPTEAIETKEGGEVEMDYSDIREYFERYFREMAMLDPDPDLAEKVKIAQDRHFLSPDPYGNFKPRATATREDIAEAVCNALGIGKEASREGNKAIKKANKAGVLKQAKPGEPVTQEQLALILDKLGLFDPPKEEET